MGRNRIFLPQEALDQWVREEKASVSGESLTILGEECSYDILPAVRFMNDVAGTGDPFGLVGRVKEKRQLDEMGAEHYMGSVVMGDSAYEVQDGFVGYPRSTSGPDIDAAVGAATGEEQKQLSDEALLTKFLLEKL